MPVTSGAFSDQGKVRTNNEDSFLADRQRGLFIVADGMGGCNAGEIASRMAVDQLSDAIKIPPSAADSEKLIADGIKCAGRAIYEAAEHSPGLSGMGTTAVVLLVAGNRYTFAWVGDSRIYLMRRGRLRQVTVDHSLVQEQVARGLISREEAARTGLRHILTRALGTSPDTGADTLSMDAVSGDYLLLCSDGLTDMVSDKDIARAIRTGETPDAICRDLVAQANKAGGEDNITVIVVHFQPVSVFSA